MLRYLAIALLIAALGTGGGAAAFRAYADSVRGGSAETTVQDALGQSLAPQSFERIVTLAPNLTEIVYFLGGFERIVGVTSYDTYPPDVDKLPKVGGYVNPGVESIVALDPDLVLCFRGNPLTVIQKLKELGTTVFVLDNPSSLREIVEQMEKVAFLICAEETAFERIETLGRKLEVREKELKMQDARPRMMMLACCLAPPFYAAGRDTFIDDLIRLAGGTNAFTGKGFAVVSPEEFLAANPEYLLLPAPKADSTTPEEVAQALGRYPYLAQTAAVKNGRIILIDEDILTRPGPRVLQALELLTRELQALAGSEGEAEE